MKTATLLIFITTSILSAYSIFKTVGNIYQRSRRVETVKSEIASLEKENEQLAKDLAYKKSKEFVEKEAREKLFMGLPGEKILIIPHNFFERLTKPEAGEMDNTSENLPIWKQRLNLLQE